VAVAASPARAYVANFLDSTVTVIDTGTNAVVTTVALPGLHAIGVAVKP
jgi:YVTN family beta-propeller protein